MRIGFHGPTHCTALVLMDMYSIITPYSYILVPAYRNCLVALPIIYYYGK